MRIALRGATVVLAAALTTMLGGSLASADTGRVTAESSNTNVGNSGLLNLGQFTALPAQSCNQGIHPLGLDIPLGSGAAMVNCVGS